MWAKFRFVYWNKWYIQLPLNLKGLSRPCERHKQCSNCSNYVKCQPIKVITFHSEVHGQNLEMGITSKFIYSLSFSNIT
jgi:hypothetical protein